MCFSASASFTAGAVLTLIGTVSLKKATQRHEKFFASIPFLFGVQQLSEGFLWLALSDSRFVFLQGFTTYTFLFFAQVLWPIWVPLSVFLVDKKNNRRGALIPLIAIGGLVSGYLTYCLVAYPVNASIVGHHVHYQQDYPTNISLYGGILYVVATITPPLFSKIKHMWLLSAAILISYIMTTILYPNYLVSVWCFFASIISISVLAIMFQVRKADRKNAMNPVHGLSQIM